MNIGDKLDDIYEAHQTNIEDVLRQMVRHFQNSASGSNRTNMRSFMDSLGHRTREICHSVRAKCIAELIGHQANTADIGNELNEDDFDQITSLLEQIDQIVDSPENGNAEKVDQDNELLNEGDFKVNPKLELEAKLNEFNQDKVDVMEIETAGMASTGFSSFTTHTLVSESGIDKFLQFQQSQPSIATDTKKRRYSVFQESSPFFAEQVSSVSKKRRLSIGPTLDTNYYKSQTKLTMEVAKQLRYPTNAILHAKSKANGQIQTFCFVCNRRLEMSFCAWKQHILTHTGEKEFYCTGCNMALSSTEPEHCMGYHVAESFSRGNDLNAFMCNICNYLQVNMHRVIEHIKLEHDNEPDDHLQQVLLLPDLRHQNTPIPTNLKFVHMEKRYQCGVRGCKHTFDRPGPFKKHFLMKHSSAGTVMCPHCREIIKKDDSVDFFGAVLNHIFMHGSIVNQCNSCEAIFANDHNVYSHILTNHANDQCRYRRDIRTMKTIERMQEVLTIFECVLCKIHVDTSLQAIQHFLKIHKSHHANFILLQFNKETLGNAVTQYTMETKGQIWQFQQHFTCGWCHEILTTKGRLNRHFEIRHESLHLLLEFTKNYLIDSKNASKLPKQNLGYDQYVIYYCGHCSDLNHSISTFYSSIEEVYDHWSFTHANNGDDAKPFRFTVAPLARCRYCDVISTFAGMKKHQAEQHSTKPFIFENLIDRTKCGLCLGGVDDALVKHFENKHQAVLKGNLFNPIALDDNTLKKLMDLRGHKKRKCIHCAEVFETQNESDRHHKEKHAPLEAEWEKFYDNKSIHLVAGCCQAKIQPTDLFRHFKEHKMLSKYRLKQYYWETKIIFGNGLVLNKHNLFGTEHDDSKEFENFIKETMDGK